MNHNRKMSKVKILSRNVDSLKLSWENVFPQFGPFQLEICNQLHNWDVIYWGHKTETTIPNLQACTCYTFRLKPTQSQEWMVFKAATDSEPFLIMHMDRIIRLQNIPQLRKLVNQKPALLNVENKDFKTPLMQVAERGDLLMAGYLVNFGADVNLAGLIHKRTPLMTAIYLGRLDLAEFFVEKGADAKARDINNLTILHYAVDSGKLKALELALKLGCDVNAKDNKGFAPLIRSVILDCSEDMIKLLFNNGADPEAKDNNGFDFKKHCEIANRRHLIGLVPIPQPKSLEETQIEEEERLKIEKQYFMKQTKPPALS